MIICTLEMPLLLQTFTNHEKWIRFDLGGGL
jgi:hypothetical protein